MSKQAKVTKKMRGFPKYSDLIKRFKLPPLTEDLQASGEKRSRVIINMLKTATREPRKKL
jgi:hypothetical protein